MEPECYTSPALCATSPKEEAFGGAASRKNMKPERYTSPACLAASHLSFRGGYAQQSRE
jgi:hypothetical protein